jgi:hypothetical protein
MFTFKPAQADGTPADPPAITLAVPNMRVGDTIPIRRDATSGSSELWPATSRG